MIYYPTTRKQSPPRSVFLLARWQRLCMAVQVLSKLTIGTSESQVSTSSFPETTRNSTSHSLRMTSSPEAPKEDSTEPLHTPRNHHDPLNGSIDECNNALADLACDCVLASLNDLSRYIVSRDAIHSAHPGDNCESTSTSDRVVAQGEGVELKLGNMPFQSASFSTTADTFTNTSPSSMIQMGLPCGPSC